ncbi:MAG: helicase-related protein, partial [Leptolyngbyaceae bacterium]|nr:helicase-related protein [Leptolyngbyaceae bacterium]
FTNDNATVYRISQDFLIPAITHQTPVKERHAILQSFREGEYRTLVASHVLNEGVDVPAATIAVLLSGSGSTREYIQRLGRVLRRGNGNKQAILYEVVAEETTEEGVSKRRRRAAKPRSKPTQLELVPTPAIPSPLTPQYKPDGANPILPRVAETPKEWPHNDKFRNDKSRNDKSRNDK